MVITGYYAKPTNCIGVSVGRGGGHKALLRLTKTQIYIGVVGRFGVISSDYQSIYCLCSG